MTRPDLDAIRARWPDGRLSNTNAREDVLALLAYVEELETDAATLRHRDVLLKRVHGALADMCCRVPMGIDEPVDAIVRASLARANQRFVDEYDARVSAEERALTAEERLERVTHERGQERKVFQQAMAEAQTDKMQLRTRSIDAIATRLQGTVCSFAVGNEMVMIPGEQVAALLEGFIAP